MALSTGSLLFRTWSTLYLDLQLCQTHNIIFGDSCSKVDDGGGCYCVVSFQSNLNVCIFEKNTHIPHRAMWCSNNRSPWQKSFFRVLAIGWHSINRENWVWIVDSCMYIEHTIAFYPNWMIYLAWFVMSSFSFRLIGLNQGT